MGEPLFLKILKKTQNKTSWKHWQIQPMAPIYRHIVIYKSFCWDSELIRYCSYFCDFCSWITGLTAWVYTSQAPTLWIPSANWQYLAWRGEKQSLEVDLSLQMVWDCTVELLLLTQLGQHSPLWAPVCQVVFLYCHYVHTGILLPYWFWLGMCKLFHILRQHRYGD